MVREPSRLDDGGEYPLKKETRTKRGLTFGPGFGYAAQIMAEKTVPEAYQLHIWIRQISPMIGRRLLVRSDSTLADLHAVIQIAFGWTDTHLHRFRIHGRDYGVSRIGGPTFAHDAHAVRLDSFQFRRNELNSDLTTCCISSPRPVR